MSKPNPNFSFSSVSNDFFDSTRSDLSPTVQPDPIPEADGGFGIGHDLDFSSTQLGSIQFSSSSSTVPPPAFPRCPLSKTELQTLSRALKMRDKSVQKSDGDAPLPGTCNPESTLILRELISIAFVDRIQKSMLDLFRYKQMFEVSKASGEAVSEQYHLSGLSTKHRDKEATSAQSTSASTSAETLETSDSGTSSLKNLMQTLQTETAESETDWLTRVAVHSTVGRKGYLFLVSSPHFISAVQLPSWTSKDFSLYHQLQNHLLKESDLSKAGHERPARPRTPAANEQDLDTWALAPRSATKSKKRKIPRQESKDKRIQSSSGVEEASKRSTGVTPTSDFEGNQSKAADSVAQQDGTAITIAGGKESTQQEAAAARYCSEFCSSPLPSSIASEPAVQPQTTGAKGRRRSLPSVPNSSSTSFLGKLEVVNKESKKLASSSSSKPITRSSPPKRYTRASALSEERNLKLPIPNHWRDKTATDGHLLEKRRRVDSIEGRQTEERPEPGKRRKQAEETDKTGKSWWNAFNWFKK